MIGESTRTIADVSPDAKMTLHVDDPHGSFLRPGVIRTTLRELAAALAPLMAKVEAERVSPAPGDLVALRLAPEPSMAVMHELKRWWEQRFPGVAMMTLRPADALTVMRPQGASLRALAEALRPVLRELDRGAGDRS